MSTPHPMIAEAIKGMRIEKLGVQRYFITALPQKTYYGLGDHLLKMRYEGYTRREAKARFIEHVTETYTY